MNKVTIRDKPAETAEPFSTEAVERTGAAIARCSRPRWAISRLSFTPDKAPKHVRNFLRLAQAGVYDGMSLHRVVKGFVIQSGHLPTRREPLNESQQKYVRQTEGGVQRSAARARAPSRWPAWPSPTPPARRSSS